MSTKKATLPIKTSPMSVEDVTDPDIVALAKRFDQHQRFGQTLNDRFENSHERVKAARRELEDVLDAERTEQEEVAKAKEHWAIEDRALNAEIVKIVFSQPQDCCDKNPMPQRYGLVSNY